MGIARSLSGSLGVKESTQAEESTTSSPLFSLGDLDPKMLGLISHLVKEYKSQEHDKTALLTAMKPYLKPERQSALDKAAGIVKMARLAKTAFGELSGGDKN